MTPPGLQYTGPVVLLMLAGAVGLELYLQSRDLAPLGYRINAWARKYPGFLALLALVAGMMVGHFFFWRP